MNPLPSRILLLTVLLTCFLQTGHIYYAHAAEETLDDSRKRLVELEKKIEATLQGLQEKQSEGGSLGRDLSALQSEIRRVNRMVKRSDRELKELDSRLEAQRRAKTELEARRQTTEQQVRKRLVALYKTGEVGLMRALLSSEETPSSLIEKYEFLSRMVRHDRQLMLDYREQALAHQKAVEELETLRSKQKSLTERRKEEQRTMKSAQATKRRLLAKVRADEKQLDNLLAELRAKVTRLNDLVKKLETEQTPSYTGNQEGLSALKGRLPWPVNGAVRVGFGTNRHGDLGTLIESNGLEIDASAGTEVKAVASGKVLFAKRLRGYGKLLIIDHGNKDYSLYAQVDQIAKEVGDQVAAGELLAYSGFEGRDYVYFEIRHGGQPLDPEDWLKPR